MGTLHGGPGAGLVCHSRCFGQLEITKLCSAWVSLSILCRLERAGTSQQEQQWIQISPTPLSSTSTCAVMQAFRYHAAELAVVLLWFSLAVVADCALTWPCLSRPPAPETWAVWSKLPLRWFGEQVLGRHCCCVMWHVLGFSPAAKDLSS